MEICYSEIPEVDKNSILTLLMLLLLLVLIVDLPVYMVLELEAWVYLLELLVIVLIILLYVSYVRFREIKLTDEGLILRFGFFKSWTPLKSIEDARIKKPPIPMIVPGVGYNLKCLVFAYNPSGRFIMVKRRSGISREVYFSVENPYYFLSVLGRAMSKVEPQPLH